MTATPTRERFPICRDVTVLLHRVRRVLPGGVLGEVLFECERIAALHRWEQEEGWRYGGRTWEETVSVNRNVVVDYMEI